MLGTKSNVVGPYIEVNFIYFDTNVFRLIVDGARVADAVDVTQAMPCFFASFYVFNIV